MCTLDAWCTRNSALSVSRNLDRAKACKAQWEVLKCSRDIQPLNFAKLTLSACYLGNWYFCAQRMIFHETNLGHPTSIDRTARESKTLALVIVLPYKIFANELLWLICEHLHSGNLSDTFESRSLTLALNTLKLKFERVLLTCFFAATSIITE